MQEFWATLPSRLEPLVSPSLLPGPVVFDGFLLYAHTWTKAKVHHFSAQKLFLERLEENVVIFKSIPQKNLVCISTTSQGAKPGWDVNVFSITNERERGRQLSLPWAGPASSDAARTPHHSLTGPWPSASATSMEIEAGGWEFVFSHQEKENKEVAITQLNYAHRTHVRLAKGLKINLPKYVSYGRESLLNFHSSEHTNIYWS